MSKDRIYDCTTCVHLRTYREPSQPFHHWECAASDGMCVGPTVMNCSDFKKRVGGECPPKADVSAFVWQRPPA